MILNTLTTTEMTALGTLRLEIPNHADYLILKVLGLQTMHAAPVKVDLVALLMTVTLFGRHSSLTHMAQEIGHLFGLKMKISLKCTTGMKMTKHTVSSFLTGKTQVTQMLESGDLM